MQNRLVSDRDQICCGQTACQHSQQPIVIEHCAPEVVLDGVIEQDGVLRDDGHLPPQTRLCDVGDWDAVDLDHA